MVKYTTYNKIINIDKFNLKLTKENNRYLLGLVILLILILLFIKNYDNIKTKVLVFMTIFIMIIIISKNLIISILISLILFLLVYDIIGNNAWLKFHISSSSFVFLSKDIEKTLLLPLSNDT